MNKSKHIKTTEYKILWVRSSFCGGKFWSPFQIAGIEKTVVPSVTGSGAVSVPLYSLHLYTIFYHTSLTVLASNSCNASCPLQIESVKTDQEHVTALKPCARLNSATARLAKFADFSSCEKVQSKCKWQPARWHSFIEHNRC